MNKIGFIGMGNMAKAMAQGFINSKKVSPNEIFAFAPNQQKLKMNSDKIGFTPVKSAVDLVTECDYVIIACKPYQIESVLNEVCPVLKEFKNKNESLNKIFISVAAGWTFEKFNSIFTSFNLEKNIRVQCIMPNTPAMVGQGVMLFEKQNSLLQNELDFVKDLFLSLGIVETLETRLMGIGGAISGCGPAFMDLIMESYADAAVKYGIARDTAYRLVSQTMLGSAKLQLETGTHPGVLKDAVCSPGGTTICGVDALEKNGLRAACISSIDAIMNKKM